MKPMLWSALSILWLFLVEQAVAQSQITSQGPCQRLIQLSWRYYDSSEETSSAQALLKDDVETVCSINDEQPRTDDGAIAADDAPSPEHFTVPSLWWQQQQMINERLIDSWRAYGSSNDPATSMAHVDVVVNSQIWPSLNYLERYWLLNQFGESAKTYEYQLRIFTGNRPVGLQVCDFTGHLSHPPTPAEQSAQQTDPVSPDVSPVCTVVLNYFDQGAIRGGRQR